MKKGKNNPSKTDDEQIDFSSCSFRVYPNKTQYQVLSNYLYVKQKFRNLAVTFCEELRQEKLKWFKKHPLLAKEWIPEEFKKDAVLQASQQLTIELKLARKQVKILWNIDTSSKKFSEELRYRMGSTVNARKSRNSFCVVSHSTQKYPRSSFARLKQNL